MLLEIDKVQIIVDEENRVDVSMDGFRINLNLKVVDVLYEIFGEFRGVHERQSSWACGLKGRPSPKTHKHTPANPI